MTKTLAYNTRIIINISQQTPISSVIYSSFLQFKKIKVIKKVIMLIFQRIHQNIFILSKLIIENQYSIVVIHDFWDQFIE